MEKLFTGYMRRQVEDRIFKMSIPELIEIVKVGNLEAGVKKKISGFIVNKVRQNVEEDTLKEIYSRLFKKFNPLRGKENVSLE